MYAMYYVCYVLCKRNYVCCDTCHHIISFRFALFFEEIYMTSHGLSIVASGYFSLLLFLSKYYHLSLLLTLHYASNP